MTIAACYLSTEGVVLGADSTSTVWVDGPTDAVGGGFHHLNYSQKLFEVGQDSTIGVTMWGMGAIGSVSHRTLIAKFDAQRRKQECDSADELVRTFSEMFWREYCEQYESILLSYHDCGDLEEEQFEERRLILEQNLSGGFCLAGRMPDSTDVFAYEILYEPSMQDAPEPTPLQLAQPYFWGVPNLIKRVIYGYDDHALVAISLSDFWTGDLDDLMELVSPYKLTPPYDLPLREAIDWVYAIVYSTIKSIKFSHELPVCGGPIEIATVSSDRPFRWVRHKKFDDAIS